MVETFLRTPGNRQTNSKMGFCEVDHLVEGMFISTTYSVSRGKDREFPASGIELRNLSSYFFNHQYQYVIHKHSTFGKTGHHFRVLLL